jgi:hypothetical protein
MAAVDIRDLTLPILSRQEAFLIQPRIKTITLEALE